MNLEQIAQQVMDYLDSVGVPAEYYVSNGKLTIITDEHERCFFDYLTYWKGLNHISTYEAVMMCLKEDYPRKSPN